MWTEHPCRAPLVCSAFGSRRDTRRRRSRRLARWSWSLRRVALRWKSYTRSVFQACRRCYPAARVEPGVWVMWCSSRPRAPTSRGGGRRHSPWCRFRRSSECHVRCQRRTGAGWLKAGRHGESSLVNPTRRGSTRWSGRDRRFTPLLLMCRVRTSSMLVRTHGRMEIAWRGRKPHLRDFGRPGVAGAARFGASASATAGADRAWGSGGQRVVCRRRGARCWCEHLSFGSPLVMPPSGSTRRRANRTRRTGPLWPWRSPRPWTLPRWRRNRRAAVEDHHVRRAWRDARRRSGFLSEGTGALSGCSGRGDPQVNRGGTRPRTRAEDLCTMVARRQG